MITHDVRFLKGPDAHTRTTNLLKVLKPQIEGKHVLFYGGASDEDFKDFEVVVRCNHHHYKYKRTDINLFFMLRLTKRFYKFRALSGLVCINVLQLANPKSLFIAGFDFYLEKLGRPIEEIGSHPMRENVEAFESFVQEHNNVNISDKVKNALEVYREYHSGKAKSANR